jgi:DNA-damage-inducible protein J
MNDVNLNIRVNSKLKSDSEKLFRNLGLNMSSAINIFLTKCVKTSSIPFTIEDETPSKKLRHALEEANYMEKYPDLFKGYNSVDELFQVLEETSKYGDEE